MIIELSTELSNYIWELKDANKDYNLKWETICKLKQNRKTTKHAIYVA